MDFNKIYCSDNLDILKKLSETNTRFDLVLTDPPYNVGKDFGNDSDKLGIEHYLFDIGQRVNLLPDITTSNAGVIWFASHLYVHHMRFMLEKHFRYQRMMIWHYNNGMSRQTNSPVTEYEPFLWFTKSLTDYTYNLDDVRVPYKTERSQTPVYKTNKKGEKIAWMADPRGAKRGDVWEYPCLAGKLYEKERTPHPTQKPESLTLDLIRAFCPKNADGMLEGKVIDIYSGSGTTAVCCEKLNRAGHKIQWMAVELEDRWVKETKRRIEEIAPPSII